MNRAAAIASLLLGGFASTIALTSTMPGKFAVVSGNSAYAVVHSPTAGAALGSIAALVTVVLVRRSRTLSWTATLGLVLLAVAALPGPGHWGLYPQSVGAGLLLGALTGLCSTRARPVLQTALATGAIGGLLLAAPIERYRSTPSRRYADYLQVSAEPADTVMLSLLALIAVALLIALRRGAFGVPDVTTDDGLVRALAVGVAVPVVGVLLHWSFVRALVGMSSTSVTTQGHWAFGLVLVPVFVLGALWLPRRHGMVLLAALAVISTGYGVSGLSTDSWPSLLVPAVLIVLGAVCGRRWPYPLAGVAALALVAVSTVFDEQPWDTLHIGATTLVLPWAASFTVAACLPSSAPSTAISLAAPAAVTVPVIAQFGWTAYTPLTTSHAALSGAGLSASTGVAVAALVVSGAAMWWLQRRPAEQPPSVEVPV